MADTPGLHDHYDRRGATRTAAHRHVLFAGDDSADAAGMGVAVDVSADGLQLRTATPLFPGMPLDVEMYPDGGITAGQPVLMRATVARVTNLADATYAVGMKVRLASDTPLFAETPPPSRTPAKPPSMEQSPAPQATRRNEPDWRNAIALVALICMVVGGLLGGVDYLLRSGDHVAVAATRDDDDAHPLHSTGLLESDRGGDRAGYQPVDPRAIDAVVHADTHNTLTDLLDTAQTALVNGDLPQAIKQFRRAADHAPDGTGPSYQARVGEAQAHAAMGNHTAALSLAVAVLDDGAGVPMRWREPAQRLIRLLADEGGGLAFLYGVNGGRGGTGPQPGATPAAAPVVIAIDREAHALRVMRAGRVIADYPVGLGRDNTTPTGRFTITNKLRNPTWYNDGNPIPHGDPRNPLGNNWMGLSDDDGPTTYGIHGTNDAESINADESDGCIRMKPEDIDEVFEAVDVGTRVEIR